MPFLRKKIFSLFSNAKEKTQSVDEFSNGVFTRSRSTFQSCSGSLLGENNGEEEEGCQDGFLWKPAPQADTASQPI